MKRTKKICTECKQERYIVSHKMCSYCYQIAYARRVFKSRERPIYAKPRPSVTKAVKRSLRKAIAPRKKRDTITDAWLKHHFGFKSQVDLFDHIWRTRPMRCPISGKDLKPFEHDRHSRAICCAHVLPKGKYPLWKLNPDNILLIHPEVHTLIDSGTQDERDNHPFDHWDIFYDLEAKYKWDYETWKNEHQL